MSNFHPAAAPVLKECSHLPQPMFSLRPDTEVWIRGKLLVVERRLKNRVEFLTEDREPIFYTDLELATLMKDGGFFIERGQGQILAPPPLSPIAVGIEAHEVNIKKHQYVQAVEQTVGIACRSRRRLLPVIQQVAVDRNEAPPAFTTLLNWIDEWIRFGDLYGTAAYSDRHDLKGSREGRQPKWNETAIEAGLERYLQIGSIKLAYATVCEAVRRFEAEEGDHLNKDGLPSLLLDRRGHLKPPSIRTFQRRCNAINRFERDWALKGPSYAKQRNLTYQTTKLPERPYEVIEVDHTRLDLILVDDVLGLPLGRPDLIAFRCRGTGMIGGYGLGFEEPSYAAFAEGLRHTLYPKEELHPAIKNGWPCWGRIENLVVDNALHFKGRNIQEAARELGFNLVPCAPRSPWLKGAIERWLRTQNSLTHILPGTTLSNVLQRRDHENLATACLTLGEFRAILEYWICEVYHAEITKGLGVIRGLGDRPLDAWAKKAQQFRTAPLPDPDLFIALSGDVEYRTINRDGITIDHIKYEGPELSVLLSHPKHRRPRERGGATLYKVVRDPFDLSAVHVHDPYEHRPITVQAAAAYGEYTKGLTLHQHSEIVRQVRQEQKEVDGDDLVAAKARLSAIGAALLRNPKRKTLQRRLARFLEDRNSRQTRSSIEASVAANDASDLLDFTPIATPRVEPPGEVGRHCGAALSNSQREDDLDAIRETKKWSSYNDNA